MKFRVYNFLFFFVALSAFAQTTVTPYQADKFVDSIGVNVHFGNLGLPYTTNGTQLTNAICSIGIRHLRDGVGTSSTQINIHNALALCGVKTDYTLPTGSTSYATYNSTVNDVEAFEPPNEQTITTAAGAANYATYLTNTFPTLIPSGFPIYAPTFTGGLNLTMFAPGGTYYSATPTITIGSGGGGTGGSCSATLGASAFGGSKVASCACSGGSGYTSAPPLTVVAQDSFGQGATVSTTVSGGALSSCTVQNLSSATSVWTVNNGHCYQAGFYPEISGWGGADFQGNGYGSIPWCKDQNYTITPSLTNNYITEAGYYTQWPIINGLPEINLAAYVPRILLNNFSQGINRTYLYELYDDLQNTAALNASNPGQAQQYTYGLLRNDLSWKPSAYAVANLINLLRDPGPSFTPTALTYTLSGTTTNVQSELFQKRDGTYWLSLWIASSVFNVNGTPPSQVTVTPQSVTVTVPYGDTINNLYQMDAGGGITGTSEGLLQSLTFNVTDKVSLVQIVP